MALDAVGRFECAGVGFVLADQDPYSGVDLDDCRNPASGEIQPWAIEIIDALNSYTEVSPSQAGVKIWVRGKLKPSARKRMAYDDGAIEVYSRKRYFTVTGQHLTGTPLTIEDRQAELEALHSRLFESRAVNRNGGPHSGRHFEQVCAEDDAILLERARRARNGAKFGRLWTGDCSGYPSASEADVALCSMLAFWTRNDRARIDSLFRQSA